MVPRRSRRADPPERRAFAAVIALRLALASTAGPDGGRDVGEGGGDGATGRLWALHDALFTLNGTFLALALLGLTVAGLTVAGLTVAGLTVAGLRSGLIPRWHGGLGLLSAALLFSFGHPHPLVTDHSGPLGLLGLTGWLIWVVRLIVYGITLARNPVDAPAADSAGSRHGSSYLAPVRTADHHPAP
ncbi:hypothetical protein [Streptomyces sp. NBC_01506]|uniref:hypothetical protein n=1 Tax=Streptomyces sp. NBC_01506 TaxID=2903887 RepID=UPI00386BCEA9